jgi:hypothetical protein
MVVHSHVAKCAHRDVASVVCLVAFAPCFVDNDPVEVLDSDHDPNGSHSQFPPHLIVFRQRSIALFPRLHVFTPQHLTVLAATQAHGIGRVSLVLNAVPADAVGRMKRDCARSE